MNRATKSPIDYIEPWRATLISLATCQMGPRLKQKIGPEDVVQEAMLNALNAWPGFRGNPDDRKELGGWLRRILLNEIVESHRTFSTLGRDMNREIALMSDSDKSWLSVSSQAVVSPTDCMLCSERHEKLFQALAKLPRDQACAVEARYFDCMKIREIAELLQMTNKMAADRVGRGLAALMKIMGDDEFWVWTIWRTCR